MIYIITGMICVTALLIAGMITDTIDKAIKWRYGIGGGR